jgi:phosphatidylglycerophosphate synthase
MRHECVIIADSPGALVELCGISILERLLRTLQRCGITRATILSGTPKPISDSFVQPSSDRGQIELSVCQRSKGLATVEQIVVVWPKADELLLVIRGDMVFDLRLVQLLLAQNSTTALVDSSVPDQFDSLVASAQNTNAGRFTSAALLQRDWASAQSGPFVHALFHGLEQNTVAALDVADLPVYSPALRRNLRPFWFAAAPPAQRKVAENILLDSIEKGSQDFPALVHAPIERFLISHLCKTPIRPNHFTAAWALAALVTTIFFATGRLFWGIVFALMVGILDGLDGKQARLKVETTKGGKLEHQLDSVLEVAWPTALAYHFYVSGQLPTAFFYLALLLVAEALDGIGKLGVYKPAEKRMVEPGFLDRVVRLVGGRRNIYVWVLIVCVVLGVPANALIIMAWWEVATAAIDLLHACWIRRVCRQKVDATFSRVSGK